MRWLQTDAIGLTGGLRYTKDRKVYTYFRSNPDGSLPNPALCFANPGGFAGFNPDGSPIGPPNAVVSSLDSSPFVGEFTYYNDEAFLRVTHSVTAQEKPAAAVAMKVLRRARAA